MICLNNASHELASSIAARIRDGVRALDLSADGISHTPSFSLGIYTMNGASLTAEEIIRMADRRMYEAKRDDKTPAHVKQDGPAST